MKPFTRPIARFLLTALLPCVAYSETLFQADFESSTPVSATLSDNASPANLNAGTAIGTWTNSGSGGGNPGAVIANDALTHLAFVPDSVISGSANDWATANFSRAVNSAAGEGLILECKLYAARQGSGRQVRISLQDSSGTDAYLVAFGLDNTKIFSWLNTSGTATQLASAGTVNSGFANPAVDSYLSWSSETLISIRIEILGGTSAAGSTGATLSVDWNGDGDFSDSNEVSDIPFGPRNAGVASIDRLEVSYGGSSGNRGIYLDDVLVNAVPATPLDPYVWTAGGDGVSLYQETNWTLNGDESTPIGQINPTTPVNQQLVVHSGNPGGSGATGTLDLGIGSLTIDGGTVRMNASSGIRNGTIIQQGGTIEALSLESTNVTLSGGTLVLKQIGAPLTAGAAIDFTALSIGTLELPGVSPSATITSQLAFITVNGQPAEAGVNTLVASDGAAGSLVTVFSGDPDSDNDLMNDAWEILYFDDLSRDGTGDFDQDGALDLAEYQNHTLPDNRDTDGDTLADGAENQSGSWISLDSTGTDPLKRDSDNDGLPDHLEVNLDTDPNSSASKVDRPNIIFVLCDDLGYGDLGAFFQNQRLTAANPQNPWHVTPHLDTIAAEGIQLRGHYCPAPVCAPSRASLLLGVHQGHSNVRNNQFDKELEDNHTFASVLQSAGYATFCVGKWGVQGNSSFPAHPMKRGFDGYFGYIGHGAGHAHYPTEDNKALYDGYTNVSADLNKCYTTDLFTARAKKFITDHQSTAPQQPFCLYLAYDTPHAELQIPTTAYPAGAGISGGLQWNGTPGAMINTATGTVDSWYHPDYANATWDDPAVAGTANPWPEVYKRYATMVRRIDDCMNDLVQTLKDLGVDDNTMIVFTSDNGPSKESYLSGTDANGYSRAYAPTFFDSFGSFDGIKRDVWEGGVRVGAIARWPDGIPANQINNDPSQFHDWMPTFAEMAKTTVPSRTDGVSLIPTLTATGTQSTPTTYVEYQEGGKTPAYSEFLAGRRNTPRNEMQMIRFGDMVGVRYDITSHADDFEIYDVINDPGQRTDLAASNPVLQQQMKDRVLQLRRPNTSAARPYDDELIPAAPPAGPLVNGLRFRGHNLLTTCTPDDSALTPAKRADSPTPDLALLTRATHCSASFNGWIQIPADGTWTFQVSTDSRATVKLHSALLLDADLHYEANSTVSATIPLKAGLHPIRIDYARTTGDPPTLDLLWQGPATPLATIPAIALFSDDGDDDDDGLSKSAEAAAGTSDYLKDSDEDGLEDNVDFDPNIANTAPADPALSNQEIAENLIAPAIGILTATQNDIGDQLTWSLANGTGDSDNGGFSISGNVLSLVGSTDFETQASYSLRVRATDLGGLFTEQSFIITVTDDSIGLTSAEWHQNEFANAPVDWSADDDHDGLSRLLEYALLADPTADSSSSLPTISQVAGKTRFSYTRRATGFHDLIYQVESSPSLEPGTWQDATLTEVSVTPGPLPEEEQVLLEVPAPSPTGLFLRLRATRQP